MSISITAINNSFNSMIASKGIVPGCGWDTSLVEALVYVVIPMERLTKKSRQGANPDLYSLTFTGGYMSTRSSSKGARSSSHASMPFMMFLSDSVKMYAPIEDATEREKDNKGKSIWTSKLDSMKWSHTVTGNETQKVAVGEKIPYNFRVQFEAFDFASLGLLPNADNDRAWNFVEKQFMLMQPQLHLLLAVSPDSLAKGKVQTMYGTKDKYTMEVNLTSSEVLSCKWVLPKDEALYDTTGTLPMTVVNNRRNYEATTTSTPSTVDVAEVTLTKPEETLRKHVIRVINKEGVNSPEVLNRILTTLTGQLEVWWTRQSAEKKAEMMAKFSALTVQGGIKAKATNVVVAPASPKVVAHKEAVAKEEDILDFSELDALLNMPIAAPKPGVKKAVAKAGGNFSSQLSVDDFDLDDCDVI